MTLKAQQLSLRNFRSFALRTIDLSPQLTILVGRNAVGKTNCIEALQLLSSAYSFKNSSYEELLHHGAESGEAELTLQGEKRFLRVGLKLEGGRKKFYMHGKVCKTSQLRGIFPSILFCPDDLSLIKDAPQLRRQSLDMLGETLSQQYASVKNTYDKLLHQRNKLLKNENFDRMVFEVLTESFCYYGVLLYLYRKALFSRLLPHIQKHYEELAPTERLQAYYQESCASFAGLHDKNVLRETLQQELHQVFAEECVRHTSLKGPHKDDVIFYINERSARIYGSQGQQRSLVLAWKYAELELYKEILGFYPLLLLDDVMSELDEVRRDALLRYITQYDIQAVITTTHLSYFSQEILACAHKVRLGSDE